MCQLHLVASNYSFIAPPIRHSSTHYYHIYQKMQIQYDHQLEKEHSCLQKQNQAKKRKLLAIFKNPN